MTLAMKMNFGDEKDNNNNNNKKENKNLPK